MFAEAPKFSPPPESFINPELSLPTVQALATALMELCALTGIDPGEAIEMKNIRNALKYDLYYCNNGFTPQAAIEKIKLKWEGMGGDGKFSEDYLDEMAEIDVNEEHLSLNEKVNRAQARLLHAIGNARKGEEVRELFIKLSSITGIQKNLENEAEELYAEMGRQDIEGQVFPVASELADVLIFLIKYIDLFKQDTVAILSQALNSSLIKGYEDLEDAQTLARRILFLASSLK